MIVGVDVSSRRIDLAWLQDGKPCRWHQELGGPKTHLIDRLRSIRIQWPGAAFDGSGVTDIAIEYPFGRGNAIAALMATTGIITRQAPPWARVAWPSAGELRAAIGARNRKADANRVICEWVFDNCQLSIHNDWDEHELDALTACVGWTRILEQQDAQ
jgi:hypothetical protein